MIGHLGAAYDACISASNEQIKIGALIVSFLGGSIDALQNNGLTVAEFKTLRMGEKIQAIKDVRNRTGCTLKEAKALVECFI